VTIRKIQTALKAQGFEPGDVDGIWGRRTIAALRAFQRARGLDGIGVAARPTLEALGVAAVVPVDASANADAVQPDGAPLVWFEEAKRLMGLRETPGAASNRVILDWASDLGIDYASDDVPWCGLFVSHCIGATLPEESLPNNPLGARNWLKFGVECEPVLGAVMVFWRKNRRGAKGHVGFYNGEDDAAYHVLGGNQSNGVNIVRIGKDRFLGARRPATVPPLTSGQVLRDTNGELSDDER
jgi:uncharacterized protein (TIGR02594 family)